jgi:vitamin B12 transporter
MIRLGGVMTRNYENVDKAKIRGVDGTLSSELTRYLYLYFTGTFQDIRNDNKYVTGTTQLNFLDGKRIPNIPPYFFNWGAELTFFDVFGDFARPTSFSLFYDGSHVSEFLYAYEVSVNQKKRVPATTLHDIGFQLGFQDKRYSLSGSVSNIMDVQRYDTYSLPLPGRVFKLMLRGTFI